MTVGIIRYPGSNCDIETFNYFNDIFGENSSFYIWHNTNDLSVLNKINLLVLPGGFAFGDRVYDKATGKYHISPGTMAINSLVTEIIKEAVKQKKTGWEFERGRIIAKIPMTRNFLSGSRNAEAEIQGFLTVPKLIIKFRYISRKNVTRQRSPDHK